MDKLLENATIEDLEKILAKKKTKAEEERLNKIANLKEIIETKVIELNKLDNEGYVLSKLVSTDENINKARKEVELESLQKKLKEDTIDKKLDNLKSSTKSEKPKIFPNVENNRCGICGGDSRMWELDPQDGRVYCDCGGLIKDVDGE